MKPLPTNSSTAQSQKIWTALILTGIVSAGGGLSLIKSSVATEDGSAFELKSQIGNNQELKPVRIPAKELPPPLDRNVVFREMKSGGITGRTFETVLLNDGRLISTVVGDANDSFRRVLRVSPQQVRQFQQFLERQRFAQFKNLDYASKTACCDISTHTLTSRDGTVRYNIVPLDGLPANLRTVVEAWNQLRGKAREIGR